MGESKIVTLFPTSIEIVLNITTGVQSLISDPRAGTELLTVLNSIKHTYIVNIKDILRRAPSFSRDMDWEELFRKADRLRCDLGDMCRTATLTIPVITQYFQIPRFSNCQACLFGIFALTPVGVTINLDHPYTQVIQCSLVQDILAKSIIEATLPPGVNEAMPNLTPIISLFDNMIKLATPNLYCIEV